jgi:hypothetical protein
VPNILHITVDNPDELLGSSAYGGSAVIRIEKSATFAGTYAEIGTVPLVSQTYAYTYVHTAGITGDWYQTRYSNAGTTVFSDYSDPFEGGVQLGLCTHDQVRQRLFPNNDPTDTTDDALIEEYIGQVTQYIQTLTRQSFIQDPASGTAVRLYDGYDATHDGYCLPIPRGIVSVALLEVASQTNGTFQTIAATDYFLRPAAHRRRPGWPATELWLTDYALGSVTPYFPDGYGNIRITGVFEWSAIPADIQDIAITTVVRAFQARRTGQSDITGTDETGQMLVSRMVSARDLRTLSRYTIDLTAAY